MGLENCRVCRAKQSVIPWIDFGMVGLANSLHSVGSNSSVVERLEVGFCRICFLAQSINQVDPKRVFGPSYPYFSGTSSTFRKHCEDLAQSIKERVGAFGSNTALDIAANDGTLLQALSAVGFSTLIGVEPSSSPASKIKESNSRITLYESFFTEEIAEKIIQQNGCPDVVTLTNVYAHTPSLDEFNKGLSLLVRGGALVVIEVQDLLPLTLDAKLDTMYHEHYFCHSLSSIEAAITHFGMKVIDFEEIDIHGGSIRVFISDQNSTRFNCESQSVIQRRNKEAKIFGDCERLLVKSTEIFKAAKLSFMSYLIASATQGKKVHGFGAAAKSNTFINYCGVTKDLMPIIYDDTVYKQNRYIPATTIPIRSSSEISHLRPDVIIVMAWNFFEEISFVINDEGFEGTILSLRDFFDL